MFGFLRRSGVRRPSPTLRRAIESSGLPPGVDHASMLAVAELHGSYSGRQVTHVRVFDPARCGERGIDVHGYADLDAHPDLVLWTGRVERDGAVALVRQAAPDRPGRLERTPADRGQHQDDEHLVFGPNDR